MLLALIAGMVSSCSKEDPPNPFDNPGGDDPNDTASLVQLDPNSIEGIYKNIFLPTCANSGCHDGTFEPDFRTIESSYSSLIYHDIIKNDTTDRLDYRVLPGDSERSMLVRRLIKDLGGNSGIMPLVTEPDSDWPAMKDEYIQNIRNWINAGAPDINGVTATWPNMVPQMAGIQTTPAGVQAPFSRNNQGMMQVTAGAPSVDIYFSAVDDQLPANLLPIEEIRVGPSTTYIASVAPNTMQPLGAPISMMGYSGSMVDYYYKYTLTGIDTFTSGQQLFVRIKVADDVNDGVYMPGYNSLEHLKNYFTIEFQ